MVIMNKPRKAKDLINLTGKSWHIESIHNEDAKKYLFSDGKQWWRICKDCDNVQPWSRDVNSYCDCGGVCVFVREDLGYEDEH